MSSEERIREQVQFLYPHKADEVLQQLHDLVQRFRQQPDRSSHVGQGLTERDAILITYGDQFRVAGEPPLQTLGRFLDSHLKDSISGMHILPFFPYSSDDGFSVIDYWQVDPALGSWEDVARLGQSYRLMFDAVVNHISSQSAWFRRFLSGDPQAAHNFIVASPEEDLSQVVRPRTLPLLTPVETPEGTKHVWTTFSEDQIDLNYQEPGVLLEMVDLLLFYAARGASIIRLDAIAYLWKEPGTTCIHLPQTHAVVKLFRAVLDMAAPDVILITETNVPHAENISYFGASLPDGGGTDEAQMVYAFPLAPLALHTFATGKARVLTGWVQSLESPPAGATFFNFLASHDGIGVRPAEGLLSTAQIEVLARQTLEHGGKVSFKANPDGTQSPYELNITWYDALNNPSRPQLETDVRRFLASQAIMLSLAGVPGIYAHSLLGSRNCTECFVETGRARSLNREKLLLHRLEEQLDDRESRTAKVFSGYRQMLQARREQRAFHPQGSQRALAVDGEVFGLLRISPDRTEQVLCLVEVSGVERQVEIELAGTGLQDGEWRDLFSGATVTAIGGRLEVFLPAYAFAWLKRRARQD